MTMPTPMPGAFQSFRVFSMKASKPTSFWLTSIDDDLSCARTAETADTTTIANARRTLARIRRMFMVDLRSANMSGNEFCLGEPTNLTLLCMPRGQDFFFAFGGDS